MTVLGLNWKLPDATLVEEAWDYGEREAADAIEEAKRDGAAGSFGRTFLGVTPTPIKEYDGWRARPTTCSMSSLLIGGARLSRPEPAVAASFASIELTEWWRGACAFGAGTLVGVHLRRCAAVDAGAARAAARLVGACIAHQHSIYSATAKAVPALLDLVAAPSVQCRRELVASLEVVAQFAGERVPNEPESALRARLAMQLEAGGSPDWMIDGLVEDAVAQVAALRACQAAFAAERSRIERLALAGHVGERVMALMRTLKR